MLFNENCITGATKIPDNFIDLLILDPPFGIHENSFSSLYNRKKENVIEGYCEAPKDYEQFTFDWMEQAFRILKPNGSMYIVTGWNNLSIIENTAKSLQLKQINHIIWKYSFGVCTKKKFVSSHYHILYYCKGKKPIFNTNCRFSWEDKFANGGSALYADLEDVWYIKKEYRREEMKNCNKLPDALVEKMVQYSSNEKDIVCDMFVGNGTTLKACQKLNRQFYGFEINPIAYNMIVENFITNEKDVVKRK